PGVCHRAAVGCFLTHLPNRERKTCAGPISAHGVRFRPFSLAIRPIRRGDTPPGEFRRVRDRHRSGATPHTNHGIRGALGPPPHPRGALTGLYTVLNAPAEYTKSATGLATASRSLSPTW